MPRAPYPRQWVATGTGSYRELSPGYCEVRWRPQGTFGPQRKRRIECTPTGAVNFLNEQFSFRNRTPYGMPVTLTWEQAQQRYADRLKSRGRTNEYIGRVTKLLNSLRDIADVHPIEVEPLHVDAWLQQIATDLQDPERKGRKCEGWAATINKKRAMVGAFFGWLKSPLRLIRSNPVLDTERYDETVAPKRDVTPKQYALVWTKADSPLRDLLDFLLLTACRFHEAETMHRTDVSKEGVWTLKKRKRNVPLKLQLPTVVLEIIIKQPLKADGLIFHRSGNAEYVDGKQPIQAGWLRRRLVKVCKRAGVELFTAHDLRSAAASWASQQGQPIHFVQALLGHTQLSTTMRYARPDRTAVSKVVQHSVEEIREKAMADLLKPDQP